MPGPGPSGPPALRWTFEAGAPIGSQVAVVGRVVYLVSADGVVHAIDFGTGKELWTATTGAETHASPSIVDGLLIVGANDGVHAFALANGHAAWSTPKTGLVRGCPAVVGHTAVFASDGGTATALDTRTGAVLWSTALGAPDNSSVAAADAVAVLGLQNGVVIALAVADGSERWRTDTGDGGRIGTVAIADGRVYVAVLDGGGPGTRHVEALDLMTGKILWRFASPGDKPAYVPAVDAERAIVEGEDGSVTALDPATGAILWQAKAPGLVEVVAAVADGVSYGASNGGFAFAVDAATGAERWRLPIQGVPYGAAVTSGLVLVGTSQGTLYAIGGGNP
jgi:eukaryotic-like serine/threonine-protein kinase